MPVISTELRTQPTAMVAHQSRVVCGPDSLTRNESMIRTVLEFFGCGFLILLVVYGPMMLYEATPHERKRLKFLAALFALLCYGSLFIVLTGGSHRDNDAIYDPADDINGITPDEAGD
jgi:hypothetical protein